ncbi:hypothetical protein SAMN02745165_02734 [Malonomonas rubra DSM 5091]|uniref:Uncharacterized protein n=1 Tax=Malonomonas rubra DSM 5091 TaxID=1122189 RepID=A0A1M6KIN6_MALRU|nr:hypothetical protein [Malonomonas rubra]SHJ58838.1 hypothetical protein SAMN02745165_02734 [Malonomonas rubra DSM 5091]
MRRYAAIMIHAYSQVSGRSLEQVTRDMHLEGIIDPDQIRHLSDAETEYLHDILKDDNKIRSWQANYQS